ncbi:hypothetical protein [Brevundimonas sp.]|uniref:hypothetical protein n=1 Tax=Brevundimonas sp. TaxID=1871086 RepID=UPI00289E68CF|nr:hypothetical protein [Brevundimonas sp.]
MFAQDEPAGAAFGVPVLDQISLRSRRSGADAKAPEFGVPFKDVRPAFGVERLNDPLGYLSHFRIPSMTVVLRVLPNF